MITMVSNRDRYIISFLIIMLSIGINVGQHLLDQMSVDRNYLIITLVAICVAGLLAHRHLFFIVLVTTLTFAINMPQAWLEENHINPDILFVTLMAVIIAPTGVRLFGWKSI
ncbi:MAG: hypothetical protein ABJ308_13135 [Halieaceae bacterium]